MSFPGFSRPGPVKTRTRTRGSTTLSGVSDAGSIYSTSLNHVFSHGWETITASRFSSLDVWRYEKDLVRHQNFSLIFGRWAPSVGDYFARPRSEFLGLPVQLPPDISGTVDGELYSSEYNGLVGSSLENELNLQGTRLMSSAWPTNPTADTAVFLGELKDGLPGFLGASLAKKGVRGVSGEWLNLQFAVMPLISDYESFKTAWSEGPGRLDKLRANSGKQVRRRRELPEKTSRSEIWDSVNLGDHFAGGVPVSPRYTPRSISAERSCKTWFVGNFYYHLPDRGVSPALNQIIDQLQYTWGLAPDLTTAWELVPFSWTADYLTNAGSLIKNLTRLSQGNQFSDAYVMRHSVERKTYRIPEFSLETSCSLEHKARRRVNPFLPAVDTDISAMQWANLLAVGWERHLNR